VPRSVQQLQPYIGRVLRIRQLEIIGLVPRGVVQVDYVQWDLKVIMDCHDLNLISILVQRLDRGLAEVLNWQAVWYVELELRPFLLYVCTSQESQKHNQLI